MKAASRALPLMGNSQELLNFCPRLNPLISTAQKGSFHTYRIENNVDLISQEKLTKGTNKYSLEGTNSSERPLTLLFPWMLSKDKYIDKYAKIYLDKGFDVVKIKVPPYDLFRPLNGAQISVGHLYKFLHENYSRSPLFVHGLSVGVYCFGELLVKILDDAENSKEIHDRLVGQVIDSPVDVYGLPLAMGKVLASNSNVQNTLEKSFRWFLNANYESATRHYNKAAQQIYDNSAKTPGLFIYSKTDFISPPEMNEPVISRWQNRNEPVFVKCFEASKHVAHYPRYKMEYEAQVSAFLEKIGLEPLKVGRAKASVI